MAAGFVSVMRVLLRRVRAWLCARSLVAMRRRRARGRRLRMPANGAVRLRFVQQTERICRINIGTYFVAWFGFSDGLKAKLPCCRLKRPFKICLVRAWAVVAAQSVVCRAASW